MFTWEPWGSGPSLSPGSDLSGRFASLWTWRTGVLTAPVSSEGPDQTASQQLTCSTLCHEYSCLENKCDQTAQISLICEKVPTWGSCSGFWCLCWHGGKQWAAVPGRRVGWRLLLLAERTDGCWVGQRSCHHHTAHADTSSYWRKLTDSSCPHLWPKWKFTFILKTLEEFELCVTTKES